MTTRVREAVPADAEAALAVLAEAAAEGHGIARAPSEVPQLDAERAMLATRDRVAFAYLVAEEDGAIVGFCTASRGATLSTRHVANVGLSVAARHRGRGVGRALMLALEAWAREVGVERLTLGVLAHNERAIRLYRSLGYQEEGVRRGHYRMRGASIDEHLMAKRVR